MTIKLMRNYIAVIKDYWNLFRKYSEVSLSDEYWKNLTNDANEIYKLHGKHRFSLAMSNLVLNELENITKDKYK